MMSNYVIIVYVSFLIMAHTWFAFGLPSKKPGATLIDGGLLRPSTVGACPKCLVPGDEEEPILTVGYIVSFLSFHERGFKVPVRHFMRALPHYYGVELHNFNLKSIAQAVIFVVVCEGYLKIDRRWDL
jgi:hypothetical protein